MNLYFQPVKIYNVRQCPLPHCFVNSELMNTRAIYWKTVLQYAPMSNGKTKKLVGTIKQAIWKTFLENVEHWPGLVSRAVYRYRCHTAGNHPSPFFPNYSFQPRFFSADDDLLLDSLFKVPSRIVETLANQSQKP